jgi:hypothetical protein
MKYRNETRKLPYTNVTCHMAVTQLMIISVTVTYSVSISFFNSQADAVIIQIYSVIKFYMFRASSVPIIRSFLQYIRHW